MAWEDDYPWLSDLSDDAMQWGRDLTQDVVMPLANNAVQSALGNMTPLQDMQNVG